MQTSRLKRLRYRIICIKNEHIFIILIPVRFKKSRVKTSLFLVAKHLSKQLSYDVIFAIHDIPELERRKVEEKRLSSQEVRKYNRKYSGRALGPSWIFCNSVAKLLKC